MATEKQRLANQQNALKSTGPKTAEGKENSRRNALKHGLAGSGKVPSRKDDRKLQKTLEAWRERLQPIDVFEEHLVARAALARVRMERCVNKDLAEVARRRRRARKRWEQRQERAVNRAASLIDTDPGEAIAELEATSLGCHWLIERWLDLGAFLEEPGWWDIRQACFAMRLLGKDPKKTPAKDPSLAKLRLAFLSAGPNIDPVEADAIFEESTRHLDDEARLRRITSRLPEPSIGRAMLQKIVADEIARLEDLRDQLWEEQDAPDRQEAQDRSLVDTSTTGARLLRYETAAEMSLHRNLNLLIRLRKVEPEHQTLSRWDKQGIAHGRIWDGSGWRYCEADDSVQSALADAPAESTGAEAPPGVDPAGMVSPALNEANFCDQRNDRIATYSDSAGASPAPSSPLAERVPRTNGGPLGAASPASVGEAVPAPGPGGDHVGSASSGDGAAAPGANWPRETATSRAAESAGALGRRPYQRVYIPVTPSTARYLQGGSVP